ncbi:NUDIX domain-containing protein [Streptomyces specialis]|uniref:NUDIX domain-containing protein n=1 Tax=Streptomyces specialis TaxID=498367 RepID=UPI002D219D5A|nr:NUDIX domain-containing protein [Streptomyces specialis]
MGRGRGDPRRARRGVRPVPRPGPAAFPDCWDLVGGHVEPGESPLGCLVREVAEETGRARVPGAPVPRRDHVAGRRRPRGAARGGLRGRGGRRPRPPRPGMGQAPALRVVRPR